jgi:hypothetical protein
VVVASFEVCEGDDASLSSVCEEVGDALIAEFVVL